ncbi:MAG: class II glutamine amidotransferase [Thermotogota bacterium]|nr:class II glutamine amidotransferase [Thermotogota bacterium]
MCRMLVMKSKSNIEARDYFVSLSKMAYSGKNSPHGDGYGYLVLSNGFMEYKKFINHIWETDLPSIKCNFAIIHARKASPGYKVNLDHVHPFLCELKGKTFAFMHNGTIYGIKETNGMIDSRFYFKIVIKYLDNYSPGEALRRAALEIEEQFKYTSLTSILTDLNHVWALKKNSSETDNYYNLFFNNSGNTQIISSEPIEKYGKLFSPSKELTNKELLNF